MLPILDELCMVVDGKKLIHIYCFFHLFWIVPHTLQEKKMICVVSNHSDGKQRNEQDRSFVDILLLNSTQTLSPQRGTSIFAHNLTFLYCKNCFKLTNLFVMQFVNVIKIKQDLSLLQLYSCLCIISRRDICPLRPSQPTRIVSSFQLSLGKLKPVSSAC